MSKIRRWDYKIPLVERRLRAEAFGIAFSYVVVRIKASALNLADLRFYHEKQELFF